MTGRTQDPSAVRTPHPTTRVQGRFPRTCHRETAATRRNRERAWLPRLGSSLATPAVRCAATGGVTWPGSNYPADRRDGPQASRGHARERATASILRAWLGALENHPVQALDMFEVRIERQQTRALVDRGGGDPHVV